MELHKNLGCLSHMLDGKRSVHVPNYICASSPLCSETLVEVFPQFFRTPSAQLSKINWTLEWEYLPGIVRFHLWGQLPFHCCYPMLYFLQQYVSCRDLGAKNLLYWPCTYSMLLNQQVQGILYHVFERKSVLKVYLFKSSANGTNNTVKNGRHMEMMSKVDNRRT